MTDKEIIDGLYEIKNWKCNGDSKMHSIIRGAIDLLEQQPFINKPCVSEGVCHEDKMQVLDKIRAEIEQVSFTHYFEHGEYYGEDTRQERIVNFDTVMQIIDKYRSESEVREEITTTCADCPYSDIYDWDQDPKTGKASPVYWCEKLKEMCDDKTKCKMQICKK